MRRKATKKQLKDGYRRLAKRCHPDKTRDDRANMAFDALRDAFDLLTNQVTNKAVSKYDVRACVRE